MFKIGSYVRVKKEDEMDTRIFKSIGLNEEMRKSFGKVLRVNRFYKDDIYELSDGYLYPAGALEAFCLDSITITSDGRTTTATYKDISATASCHEDDDYDFFTGAELAFCRLLEKLEVETSLHLQDRETGEDLGQVGEPTNLNDYLGDSLSVGDLVMVYTESTNYGVAYVCKDIENESYFIFGAAFGHNSNDAYFKDGTYKFLGETFYISRIKPYSMLKECAGDKFIVAVLK